MFSSFSDLGVVSTFGRIIVPDRVSGKEVVAVKLFPLVDVMTIKPLLIQL